MGAFTYCRDKLRKNACLRLLNTTSPDLSTHSGFRIKDKSTDFKHTRSLAQEPLGAASPAEKERPVRTKYLKKSAVVASESRRAGFQIDKANSVRKGPELIPVVTVGITRPRIDLTTIYYP